MKLNIYRTLYSDKTIGELYVNDVFYGYTLEDRYTGIVQSDPSTVKYKIDKQSCIGIGDYRVVVTFSPRFNKLLPLILNTNGFSGIRFHAGEDIRHTDGCILISLKRRPNNNLYSDSALVTKFTNMLNKVQKTEKITLSITIKNDFR